MLFEDPKLPKSEPVYIPEGEHSPSYTRAFKRVILHSALAIAGFVFAGWKLAVVFVVIAALNFFVMQRHANDKELSQEDKLMKAIADGRKKKKTEKKMRKAADMKMVDETMRKYFGEDDNYGDEPEDDEDESDETEDNETENDETEDDDDRDYDDGFSHTEIHHGSDEDFII